MIDTQTNTRRSVKRWRLLMTFFIVLGSAALPLSAQAKAPSFTFIEVEYVASGDLDISDGAISVGADLDGFAVTGSLDLGLVILQASRFELDGDGPFSSTLEDTISTLAVGLAFEVGNTQLYGVVRARQDELSVSSPFLGSADADITSVGAEIGVRWNIIDRFEVNANVGTPAFDEGTSAGVGIQFFITKGLGVVAEYNVIDIEEDSIAADIDTASIGLRYSF